MSAKLRGAIPTHPSAQVQTVLRWLEALSDGDIETLNELLAPEFESRMGPESVKKPANSKEASLEFLKALNKQLFTEMSFDIHEIIEGEGRVVVHLTTDGKTITNHPYKHKLIQIHHLKSEGGKLQITSVFEFMDSLYVAGAFAAEKERQTAIGLEPTIF
ncbi:hypothetical protein K474DRAFT_1666367 [Panus rudis PR-1116 ss-1]|nr:hypothetical protein K474DRAFT_1666367 [Panus rudis PR-1116 ss-1]